MTVYLVMLLVTIPRVEHHAPDHALFDLSPAGYSHSDAMLLLDALGTEGRAAYLVPQIVLDFVYPGLFAICFSMMMTWVFSKRFRPDSKIFYLATLPVFAGLFDYVENLLIIRMITRFPDISDELVRWASSATLLKSAITTGSFLLLVLGFLYLLVKKTRTNSQI